MYVYALMCVYVLMSMCYGLTARKVEGAGTQYICKVNHVLRTIVIAYLSISETPALFI